MLYFEQHQANVLSRVNYVFDQRLEYFHASEPYQVPKAASLAQALDFRSHEMQLTETRDVIRRDNQLMVAIYSVGAAGTILSEGVVRAQAANSELQSTLRRQRGGG